MGSTKLLGTAQVPPKMWKAARLIGSTPFSASSYDQRASYCMYVPESHYRVDTLQKLPLIVNVHGSLRRAERCRDSLVDLADSMGAAVLAPLFPAGIEDPSDWHNYKFLRYRDIRYDLILLSMVDEVAQRWPEIETKKFYLAGFSGGGQFVSRFFYLHPDRLEGVSIGAPGMVTSLDRSLEWPKGLKDVEKHFNGLSVDVKALKSVAHVQLIVGEDNTEPPGGGLLQWRATQKNGDNSSYESVGKSLPSRTETMAMLCDELKAVGVQLQFDVVPGAAHDSVKVFPRVVTFLRESLSCHQHWLSSF